ncbi:peptidase M20 domain-containing protein 2 isoform X1 [Xiphophorus couchianus]|uniref:peptidase M20 domain-containing protein 2 isoform X1 n=1 Tax=Xiphophorus couchianus TaxID=32473 RepID=UPI0010160E74|nr:peptidase M20 domain-containing protein 2 isoform X1 [Xiphophorus couchianus]XP_032404036.1 peptidase M20 domain-containing protein 2 isoform X1 [Xiphophorus hellerii]
MANRHQMKEALQQRIDSLKQQLHSLSRDIWTRPEVAGEEVNAHDVLVRFFSEQDQAWTVQSHYELPTAFRASWGSVGTTGEPRRLNVGFLCEYDALPEIGHACGHNLIAEVGAAAAVGLKAAVETQPELPVEITVLGTPAEEAMGGKIDLIRAGAFTDVDLIFMAHPAQQDASFLPTVTIAEVSVKYHGKASHASAYPWEGVNALDAAVLAYSNLSALRQQLKPEWKLHGIIKHGGAKPNIIPAYSELEFYLRTPRLSDLWDLKAKAEACFRAAALATGCQVEIIYPAHTYSNILPNDTLATLYKSNGEALGMVFPEQPASFSGSTDFGNVSFIVPGIHPFFHIGTDALNHTEKYAEAAGAEEAQLYALRAAKALAMTAVDVLCCSDLLQRVRDDFRLAKLREEK